MSEKKSKTFEIERLVLGAFLLSESNYWPVADRLRVDHFTTDLHQRVFGIMRDEALQHRPLTIQHISFFLTADDCGGVEPIAALAVMAEAARTHEGPVRVGEYVDDLSNAWVRRAATEAFSATQKKLNAYDLDPSEQIEALIDRLTVLRHQHENQGAHMLADVVMRVAERAAQPDGACHGISPHLPEIRDMTGLWQPGDLVLIGGASGGGKTALAVSMCVEIGRSRPVDLYELEMTEDKVGARVLSASARIMARKIIEARMNVAMTEKVLDAAYGFKGHQMRIIDAGKQSVAQIRIRAMARKRESGLDMIVIDHAKLLSAPNAKWSGPLHQQVYDNTAALKALAKELNCVVVLLCQFLKDDNKMEGSGEPKVSDFFGGGVYEHADIMLSLFDRAGFLREKAKRRSGSAATELQAEAAGHDGKMDIYKLKDRSGTGRGRATLKWESEFTTHSSLDDQGSAQQAMALDEIVD